jgi:hypothetical protein
MSFMIAGMIRALNKATSVNLGRKAYVQRYFETVSFEFIMKKALKQ